MSMQEQWEKALKQTEVLRHRVQALPTFEATHMPYIFLAESALNKGDTVVRKGEVMVEKPSLVLPNYSPQFEGFEFDKEHSLNEDFFVSFLMVRGIKLPSLRYNNKTDSLDLYEGHLTKAIEMHRDQLQKREDVLTGLVTGPEDCWQFSLLILICTQILRQADGDIRKLFDRFKDS